MRGGVEMRFGAKEVMVIAALAFGITAAGCSTSFRTNLAMDPHLRAMNAWGSDYQICLSKYEIEFYYPDNVQTSSRSAPVMRNVVPVPSMPVKGGSAEAGVETGSLSKSWAPTLPAFFK